MDDSERFTRGRVLWAGAAAAAGAAAIGSQRGDGASVAASGAQDARILNFFLALEHVQEAFYREAVQSGRLDGELLALAEAVARQEGEHVRVLAGRLGDRAQARPRTEFGDALASPDRFRRAAIDLEEAVLAGYVGQVGTLGRRALRAVAPLVSVEARQVAWLRDLEGVGPAPRAADPPRKAGDVIAELRQKGFIA